MNDTQIKTRHGLILQGALAEALKEAGYKFDQDYQYEETCEIPDFLIPDSDSPDFIVETHQTDARNSFQMKTLRAFTAVTESKAFYGNNLVCVNVLFGDPDRELPPSNVRAMCGIFDVNIIPRNDATDPDAIVSIEAKSLELAMDEDKKVEQGIAEVVESETVGITELAKLLRFCLPETKANPALFPLWKMERSRAKILGDLPTTGVATYYKRMMLRALYLTDADFAELVSKGNPDACSPSTQEQLVTTGLTRLEEAMDGDHFILEPQFTEFIQNPDAPRLRKLCKDVLTETPEMHWFFEDIRSASRRVGMARIFLEAVNAGKDHFERCFRDCFNSGNYGGLQHTRCWLADLMPLLFDLSHNHFNRAMFLNPDYTLKLGNPFNNVVIRSSRLGKNEDNLEVYQDVSLKVFFDELKKNPDAPSEVSILELARRLLNLRLGAAIKLRKLDPLCLVAIGISRRLGLLLEPLRVRSIVGDLANTPAVAQFSLFVLKTKDTKRSILANFLSVHDNNGDHKSKEWGARRLATLYRMIGDKVRPSEYQNAIFVLDGEWTDKDVARLYRSGWNHVVRLDDLESKLKEIFDISEKRPEIPLSIPFAAEAEIEIPEIELPLAAEDEA